MTTANDAPAKAKKRTEWDRRYDRCKRCKDRLNELYRETKRLAESHDQFLQRLLAWRDYDEYKRCGTLNRQYLEGYSDALSDQRWRNDLVWLQRWPDGIAFTSWMGEDEVKEFFRQYPHRSYSEMSGSGAFWKHARHAMFSGNDNIQHK